MKKIVPILASFLLFQYYSFSQSKDSLWGVLQFTVNNKNCLAVINMEYKNFKEKSKYPVALFFDVETREKVGPDGWPSPEENLIFNSFENQIINLVDSNCIAKYIGRTILDGKREIIFYIDKKEKIDKALKELKQTEKMIRVFDYSFYDDPTWEQVYMFYK